MAEILIKGLALPKNGDTYGLHLSIFPNGDVYVEYDEEPTATAIELPEHGDMIDRMELAMNVAKAQEELKGKDIDPFMLLGDVLRWIDLAPTIVEAST